MPNNLHLDVVVRHISVGVASEFDGIKFDVQDFTECIHHHGAPINGRDFLLNCGTPLYGRYVALYIPHEYADMKLQLCNVEVLTLPGKNIIKLLVKNITF